MAWSGFKTLDRQTLTDTDRSRAACEQAAGSRQQAAGSRQLPVFASDKALFGCDQSLPRMSQLRPTVPLQALPCMQTTARRCTKDKLGIPGGYSTAC